MKIRPVFILVFSCLFYLKGNAQFSFDASLGFLTDHQSGFVLSGVSSSVFYSKIDVERKLFCFGGNMTAFYSLKRPKAFPAHDIAYGPEAGLGFYYSKRRKSVDPLYYPKPEDDFFRRNFGILQLPLAFSVRFGSLASQYGTSGIAFSAGTDIMYLNLPDEKGIAVLPTVSSFAAAGRNGIRIVFFVLPYRSVFKTNEDDADRIRNKFFRIEYVRYLG